MSETVARCMSRFQRRSSYSVPRCMVQRLSRMTRSCTHLLSLTYRNAFEGAVARAKLEDFHFHDLRHTFASWTVQRGATLQEVKDLLGHSTLAMVMRYAHLSPEHLRSAVARLDAALPTVSSAQVSAQEVVAAL